MYTRYVHMSGRQSFQSSAQSRPAWGSEPIFGRVAQGLSSPTVNVPGDGHPTAPYHPPGQKRLPEPGPTLLCFSGCLTPLPALQRPRRRKVSQQDASAASVTPARMALLLLTQGPSRLCFYGLRNRSFLKICTCTRVENRYHH